MGTSARLDAFARGEIVGLRKAGKTRDAIRKAVKQNDGKLPSLRAVDNVQLNNLSATDLPRAIFRDGARPSTRGHP